VLEEVHLKKAIGRTLLDIQGVQEEALHIRPLHWHQIKVGIYQEALLQMAFQNA